MSKNYLVPIIFFLVLIFTINLSNLTFKDSENKSNISIKKCTKLNYENALVIHPSNFSSLSLEIKFDSIRDWRKENLDSLARAEKNRKESGHFRRFHTDRKRVDGTVIFKISNKLECFLKARIRSHGDLEDHFSTSLPSLSINLKEGHVFGITKFKLLKPETRKYDNELIAANLFRELGFLSPRTSNVYVKFNKNTFKFIFQESIVKEFLENNNKREFPIYSGDERYAFFDSIKNANNKFSNYKLDNSNYIKQSQAKEIIAKYGLSILNKINFYSKSEFYPESIDLSKSSSNLYGENLFEDFKTFSALMIAMNSNHNLSRDDLRIYFNKENDKFYPIYYDGSVHLGDQNLFLLEDCISSYKKMNCNYTPSAVEGSKEAIKLLEGMNIEKFKKNLFKNN